jgi:TRAP-type uncharacterized transport system substrate-binding protein
VAASIAVFAFAAVLMWLAFTILSPTPPRSVTMATDPQGNLNADLAKRYCEFFARNRIDLKLFPTAGAIESVARLQDPKSDVGVAICSERDYNAAGRTSFSVSSTLFYEPLWFFVRGRAPESYQQLRGLRLSIGPEGSAYAHFP